MALSETSTKLVKKKIKNDKKGKMPPVIEKLKSIRQNFAASKNPINMSDLIIDE